MADTKNQDPGLPGGGRGRVDDVKGSPVYPGSGPYPSGEAEIRTPGSLAHGQVDDQGRPVEGSSEIIMTDEGTLMGGATPAPSEPPKT